MSLRYLKNTSGLLIVSVCVLCLGSGRVNASEGSTSGPIYATPDSVATSLEQGIYAPAPIAAGTLTLDDVLKAHTPKKARSAEPAAPTATGSTGSMMLQGLAAVFQKYGVPEPKAPTVLPARKETAPVQEQLQETSPTRSESVAATAPLASPAEKQTTVSGVTYEPGQAPKNLAAMASPSAEVEPPQETPVSRTEAVKEAASTESPAVTCTDKVETWEKNCGEAGYPAAFVGKVTGETRTNCTDGTLQDVWVTNSCAPSGTKAPASVLKIEGVCGSANGSPSEEAPSTGLCLTGSTSPVRGDGPWTWTCTGSDGEQKDRCEAPVARRKAQERQPEHILVPPPEAAAAETAPVVQEKPKTLKATVEAPAPAEPSAPPPFASTKTTASDTLCGEAAETMAYEAPERNLCRVGTASSIAGNGPWTWTCTSNEGLVSACQTLSLFNDLSSVPEEPAPPTALPEPPKEPASTKPAVTPQPPKPSTPDLACGEASGKQADAKPETGLCLGGKPSDVKGSNPWRWMCTKGKKKISCGTIKPIDGACGEADGKSSDSTPTKGLCESGLPSLVKGKGPWTWVCSGADGGASAACSASVSDIPAPPAAPELQDRDVTAPPPPAKKSITISEPPVRAPEGISIESDKAPAEPPRLSEESKPLTPPKVKNAEIKKAPPAKEETPRAGGPRGAPLALSPALSTILFEAESEKIDPKVTITLNKLAALLQQSNAHISLTAYADDSGQPKRTLRILSLNRAIAVRDYLTSKGIPENRITVHAEDTSPPSGYPDRVDVKVNH